MNWKGKNVLITGAGGFIGSHLVEKFAGMDSDVTAFVHYNGRNDLGMLERRYTDKQSEFSIIKGDITDCFAVDKAIEGMDYVFHLAALIGIPYSYIAPESYVNINVKGTLNVLEACKSHDICKMIHTSTSEVYGSARYTPIDEQHVLQGQSPYSASKIAADKLAESYYNSFELPVTIIRPFNTYGPRQSARAVIPTIIIQALCSDEIRLGSLTPVRDMNFVLDTIDGYIKIAECQESTGMTINFGSGKGYSIKEIAETIVAKINPESRIVSNEDRIRPDKSEVRELICDNSLAREITRWAPSFTLEEGIDITIEWIKNNLDSYKPAEYII